MAGVSGGDDRDQVFGETERRGVRLAGKEGVGGRQVEDRVPDDDRGARGAVARVRGPVGGQAVGSQRLG